MMCAVARRLSPLDGGDVPARPWAILGSFDSTGVANAIKLIRQSRSYRRLKLAGLHAECGCRIGSSTLRENLYSIMSQGIKGLDDWLAPVHVGFAEANRGEIF